MRGSRRRGVVLATFLAMAFPAEGWPADEAAFSTLAIRNRARIQGFNQGQTRYDYVRIRRAKDLVKAKPMDLASIPGVQRVFRVVEVARSVSASGRRLELGGVVGNGKRIRVVDSRVAILAPLSARALSLGPVAIDNDGGPLAISSSIEAKGDINAKR